MKEENFKYKAKSEIEKSKFPAPLRLAKYITCYVALIALFVLIGSVIGDINQNRPNSSDNYSHVTISYTTYKSADTTLPSKTTTQQATTTTAYEWKLNTNSTGKDWNSVNDTEKDVWCSNSIATWRLMGYDIPSGVSVSHMHKTLDYFYQNEDCVDVDLTTASESYAIANGVY